MLQNTDLRGQRVSLFPRSDYNRISTILYGSSQCQDSLRLKQQAIRGLPPRFRPVVHLRCFGQLSFSEIGRTLQMPETTAKTYFHRALTRLRSALADSAYVS